VDHLTATRFFLDTNIFGELADSESGDLRERLLVASERGVIRVDGSLEVLSEIAGIATSSIPHFKRVRNLQFRLVGGGWMMPWMERCVSEVCFGGCLPDAKLYLSRDVRRDLKRLRHDELLQVASEVKRRSRDHKRNAERARDAIVEKLGSSSVAGALSAGRLGKLYSQWLGEVDVGAYCRDLLDDGVEKGRFMRSERVWEDPQTGCPSLWHYMRFTLARIAQEVGEGRRINPSDEYDARHYAAAAAYSGHLVTEDKAFARTCSLLGDPSIGVLSISELGAKVLPLDLI
jgi:predicted nucleic acid-binding protein